MDTLVIAHSVLTEEVDSLQGYFGIVTQLILIGLQSQKIKLGQF